MGTKAPAEIATQHDPKSKSPTGVAEGSGGIVFRRSPKAPEFKSSGTIPPALIP